MFREGHYLEVIKASERCLATAIVTIKEKTVEYKRKKITTNKWLDLQDWASLYSIIRRAIICNYESRSRDRIEVMERQKSTSHLEVTWKFETTECPEDGNRVPTIRVSVAPAKTRSKNSSNSKRKEGIQDVKKNKSTSNHDRHKATIIEQLTGKNNFVAEKCSLEEYVPPEVSNNKEAGVGLKYVPSQKSMLLKMGSSADINKYTPTIGAGVSCTTKEDYKTEVTYVPNSLNSLNSLTKMVHERYDPCDASSLSLDLSEAYVPSSKGAEITVEEYQPDFASKTMKFDESYIPSSTYAKVHKKDDTRKRSRKSQDTKNKKSSLSRSLISKIAKREL